MDDERHLVYLGARAVLLALLVGLFLGGGTRVHGQSSVESDSVPRQVTWHLVVDGSLTEWPEAVARPALDSVRTVGKRLVNRFQREGYYYAAVDSAVVDTSQSPVAVRVHVRSGPQSTVGRIRIQGANVVPRSELRRLMDTEVGGPLDPQQLEADIDALLDRYEREGYLLTQIRVAETRIRSSSPLRMRVTLSIKEGPELWLKRIAVPDDARTSPGLVARLAGLQVGERLTNYDPAAIQATLEQSEFFQSVGQPELSVTDEGGAILHVPVEEAAPGSFDLVLGYLPPSPTGSSGQLVGSGHLLLEHLFGGGRRLDLTLDRRPGQTSIFDLSLSDPYVFGLPLRLTGQFEGEQRDSTFGERSYGGAVGYRVHSNVEVTGTVRRTVVRPGQAGTTLQTGRQRVPRSQTLFYGIGVEYDGVDRPVNPRRGLRIRLDLEQGMKDRSFRRIQAGGDTSRVHESVRQEQLRGTARLFVPLFERQVLVGGMDGAVRRSRTYDRADLFRFGGAESLRGYDEDRYLGNVTGRALLEYRVQLDRRSYAYAFGDLGYVARPNLVGLSASRDLLPGYGVGIQIQTAIGLIKTTYGLNPDAGTPVDGRIHFGLSVGL